ncbi:hypothetical protein HMPREF1705_04687 [Acetomicrobium hydrogeniformans ATCC BAA-1850]|uniref:Uncharacterized protein n=1 Tax=Acetomicrobium hydrogeniformans ATCC BAA-1850 TaxID=592015 RepID=A0A0T5XC77_9BACT|nr:hypothetical protein HMPREF1705_04687 [Acetomicrobium hydrogeniformans ATCC BAA-1850]
MKKTSWKLSKLFKTTPSLGSAFIIKYLFHNNLPPRKRYLL